VGTCQSSFAQEATIEFENFTNDISKFQRHTPSLEPPITGGPGIGAGGSGGLTLPGRHALTYSPLSYGFSAIGESVTVSTLFKTGTLIAPTGFEELLGQVYVTTSPTGNPIQLTGSNDFFASLYRDSSGAYLGISGQTSSGAVYPFLEADVSIASNRWYELSATFTRDQQSSLDVAARLTDYGPAGMASEGIIGSTTAGLTNLSAVFADTSWYGGFAADADGGVKADRFRLDVPGNLTVPTSITIEPTYDVTFRPVGSPRYAEGSTSLAIDSERKALAEFDLRAIPANADIAGALLVVQPLSSQNMTLRALGYQGDGVTTSSDPSSVLVTMGTSQGTLQAGLEKVITLDQSYLAALLRSSTHLGLLLERTSTAGQTSIVASEASLGTAPTLLIEYTVPEANGDFDADGDIDGQDLLLWQRGRSPRPYSMIDLAQWNGRFGTAAPSGGVPAPEPTAAALALPAITVVLALRTRAPR
jgi:hypothetical protein